MTTAVQYLRAEWIRARGSTLWWLALAGLLLGAVFTVFGLQSADGRGAVGLLSWHGLLITGMAAPLAVLFAGTAEARERDSRGGGTIWRPVSPRATRATRLVVVWLALAVFCALCFGVAWIVAVLTGMSGASKVALVGLFVWVGVLGPAGLGAAGVRRFGLGPSLAAAAVWQIVLGYFVERDWWWFNPAAWPLRLVLPTMGLHFNLLPLEPGALMFGETPWSALSLCGVLAVVGFTAAVVVGPSTYRSGNARAGAHRVETSAAPTMFAVSRPATVGFGAALRGVNRAARTPAVVVAVAVTCLVLVLLMRYPVEVRHGIITYAIMPIGAGVLPTLVWPRLRPAWALMRVEHRGTVTSLCVWVLAVVAGVTLVAAVTGGGASVNAGDAVLYAVLTMLTAGAFALISLVITVRFGVVWSLAATIVWTVFAITIGGDVLAQTPMWILAVTAWPETATTLSRAASACALAIALLCIAFVGARRALTGMRCGMRRGK